MNDLRVLSLWQPWSTLWADPALPKTIETRPKPWPSTIPLPAWALIHAAAKPARLTIESDRAWAAATGDVDDIIATLHPARDRGADPLPLGAVIGAAHVTACLPIVALDGGLAAYSWPDWLAVGEAEQGRVLDQWRWHEFGGEREWSAVRDFTADLPYGDYTPGRYGYVTDRTLLLPEPVPWRGAQGFQRPTPELLDAVTAQLGEEWDR